MWRRKSIETSTDDPLGSSRDSMVRKQIRDRGVTNERVLDVMRAVPRHVFVPENVREKAYQDRPLEIGRRQTISQPYMVALMTDLIEPHPTDRVLEIGSGSGYQTAVLASLVEHVTSIERIPELAEGAQRTLDELGFDNVTVHVGDGTLGYPKDGPYDGIVVTAGSPRMPGQLKEQLAEGGRLVCPVGPRDKQRLIKVVRRGGCFDEQNSIACVFVPLVGEDGWSA